jgi:RNA methyltransferase, TrmH family
MLTSITNRRVKWVRSLQTRRRVRWSEQFFVVEGLRQAREALACGQSARLVFYSDQLPPEGKLLVDQFTQAGAEIEKVSREVMEVSSTTESPPGLLVVQPFPELSMPDPLSSVLILDHIADPGNLGTILRSARASGAQAVFVTEGCVDIYNPKVVRAGMGAHFHTPVQRLSSGQAETRLAGLSLWLAEADEGSAYYDVNWQEPSGLIIGSEAHGVGAELASLATGKVRIPMPGQAESLNAAMAATVLLFEIVRQRENK